MSICVKNLCKSFQATRVIDHVNFSLASGEMAALLGPSGCGKTTLLRMIAGLEFADAGEVYFDKLAVTHLPAQKRRIGFVFQSYALFHHMTVFDNIAFGLRMLPRRQRPAPQMIRAKVTQLLALIELSNYANHYPTQLSGGQRQRVALARALANDPNVLLLDEPFAALDAKVRATLRRWLRQFQQELNITTIFVTHDQEEALDIADKVILVNHGQIEQVGTPEQVYRQPKTAFVAQFLGEVNVLQGHISQNRLYIGSYYQPVTNTESQWVPSYHKQSVLIYIRPHEFSLTKQPDPMQMVGQITRFHPMGSQLFLEVLLVESATPISVIIKYTDHLRDNFKTGDTVYLKPQLVNYFTQDGNCYGLA